MTTKAMMKPKWTVVYNIVSEESSRWVGTGWEFFDDDDSANRAYARHVSSGNVPTKRPFHFRDDSHLGAAHRDRGSS